MVASIRKKVSCQSIGKQASDTTTSEISYNHRSWGLKKRSREGSEVGAMHKSKIGGIS